MKTTKAIYFDVYSTEEGLEVCRLSKAERCPFLGYRRGIIPVCTASRNELDDSGEYIKAEPNCFLRRGEE